MATRLVLAGGLRIHYFVLIIMSILRYCILYMGQINEHSDSDSDFLIRVHFRLFSENRGFAYHFNVSVIKKNKS